MGLGFPIGIAFLYVFLFDNTRTICGQCLRYFADWVVIPEGHPVKIFNEFGSSIKIFVKKQFTFSGTPNSDKVH